jgi:hypothetical protein
MKKEDKREEQRNTKANLNQNTGKGGRPDKAIT